ncbi:MAG: hypothetical protein AAF805_09885 [Planctomycetota bacterium]
MPKPLKRPTLSRRPPPAGGGRTGVGMGGYRLVTLLVAAAAVLAARAQLGTPAAEQAIAQVLATPPAASPPVAEAPRVLAEADLTVIRDNAPFRSAETPAWDASIAWAAAAEPADAAPRVGYASLAGQPDAYRGRVVTVAGEVRRIEAVTPADNDAGVTQLWRVVLAPEGGGVWPIFVYTTSPPPSLQEPPYPAWATGVFFKKLSYPTADGVGVAPVIVASALRDGTPPAAATPPTIATADKPAPQADHAFDDASPAGASLGRDLLTQLGYEVQRFNAVTDKRRLTSAESPAFYALLGAVGATPASQLARLATAGLDRHAAAFTESSATDRRARQTASAVATQHAKGEYSVTPLFTAPERMRGELVRFDAVVRRVTPIDCSASEAAAEHGVARYYELEAFPEDSQNLPIVFCVRELPPGFPIGESLRRPTRLAGFFFKQWAYRTRKRDAATGGDKRQFAPLLIGRAPIALAPPSADSRPGLAIGVVGTAGLVFVAISLWRLGRRDRVHERGVLSRYRRADAFDADRLRSLDAADEAVNPAIDAKLAQTSTPADDA